MGALRQVAGSPDSGGFKTECPDTLPALEESLGRVAAGGPAGDYYEFGLFRGYTFWYAQRVAARVGLTSMRFWGFDSFVGVPAVTSDEAAVFRGGDYACDRRTVEANLTRYGVDWTRTSLVEGYYDTSLRHEVKVERGMGPCAVALIDCDLYESTVPVLEFLADRLQDGTVLLFDDYNCFDRSDDHGERRAFREFLAAHGEWEARPLRSFGWHGEGFTLHRRAAV